MKVFVIVHGGVQGVGFRGYCRRLANQLKINGLVKNASDGTVLLFLEGKSDAIEEIITLLKNCVWATVEKVEVFREGEKGFQPAWRNYCGFEIDYVDF
ncbi:MAG: acylphosphatase [Candidatus Micrarchaeota archaeon]